MQVLIDEVTGLAPGTQTDADQRERAYASPAAPWWRANMVETLDGAATGGDGRSGSINDAADQVVFAVLRSQADAVVVGAGTVRAEGYGPLDVPLVVVSASAAVPDTLRGAPAGSVLVATRARAENLADARATVGDDHVLVLGDDAVSLPALRDALAQRGLRHVLCEGGPSLLGDLLAADVLDELCLTIVPRALGGDARRIVGGTGVDVALAPRLLLEESGTVLGRWFVTR